MSIQTQEKPRRQAGFAENLWVSIGFFIQRAAKVRWPGTDGVQTGINKQVVSDVLGENRPHASGYGTSPSGGFLGVP